MKDKIEIKPKECCLTCEHFMPDGIIGLVYGSPDTKREISCGHMPVCKKYLETE